MHESFLKDIALVLGVAAVTSAFTSRFRLPSVLGYLIAGFIIGPYIPIPLLADQSRVNTLSEFGVILVMFSIGLEFSLSKFFKVLPTSGVTAVLEVGAMFLMGISVGYLFDWSTSQAVFLGGALAISSTMIVSKIYEEYKPDPKTKSHVLGVLVIQDVFAILLLTILGAYASTNQLNLESIIPTISKLIFILIFITVIGLFLVPKFIRQISLHKDSEVLVIVATGLCFTVSLAVESLGFSVALGAFLAGILVSESGESYHVEKVLKPLKDVFVAIFFVSIGMIVNPIVAFHVLPQSLLIAVLVVLSQFVIVFMGSVLSGRGLKRALYSSLSLGQIGEFSFIIATIGVTAGMVNQDFQAIVLTVAILTSMTTPFLWKNSEFIVTKISQWIPSQLRVAIGLYETWFDRMKGNNENEDKYFGIPKKVLVGLFADSLLLIFLPPIILKYLPEVIDKIGFENDSIVNSLLVLLSLFLILSPVMYGFAKLSSALIIRLSHTIFADKFNVSSELSPVEKLFKLTVLSVLYLIVGFPILASLRPFLNTPLFVVLVSVTISFIMYRLWVSAGQVAFEFEGGAEKLVSLIRKQTYNPKLSVQQTPLKISGLEDADAIVVKNTALIGKSLSDLDIRNCTGATVVSIFKEGQLVMFPSHSETIVMGDIIHIWGSDEAKKKCKNLLSE